MILETIQSEGIAHLSYLLADDEQGVGAVIDPRRDVEGYLDLARQHAVAITHIFETHIHEDFVSGSRELAAKTGAAVYVGKNNLYGFGHQAVSDGDEIRVGGLTLQAIHTPGHTPEHMCYLIRGGKGAQAPWGIFTGDALFAGDVGRTDLLGDDQKRQCTQQLHHSLFARLLPLGDGIAIYPAHGKGSSCGGNIGDRQASTIGYERLHNPKLQVKAVEGFIQTELASLQPIPFYYPRMHALNTGGPELLGHLPDVPPLSPQQFKERLGMPEAVLIDTREIEAFGGAHIKGALNIAFREEFPVWAGWMVQPNRPILLVQSAPSELEAVQRHLLRVGLEWIAGYLMGGMRAWYEAGFPIETMGTMSVQALREQVASGQNALQVLDVRRPDEWRQGHIPSARHLYVPYLPEHLSELDPQRPTVAYCSSGFRSGIAASLLQQHGFEKVFNVPGSMRAWEGSGYPLER